MPNIHQGLTPDERARIMADPNVQAIMRDPRYTSPQLRDAAVNDYLSNDPRSPFRYLFGAESNLRNDGVPAGGLHYDPATGQTQYTNTYGHPGTMKAVGLGSVAAGGALASLGLLPGLGNPAAYIGNEVNGVANAAQRAIAGGAAAGGAAGGGLGTVAARAGGAGGIGGKLLDSITSGNGIAGLAGLIATLATRPNGGGGSGDLMSQNPQLSELLNMSAERARRTDPLHQSITQLAMQRLPTNVQR